MLRACSGASGLVDLRGCELAQHANSPPPPFSLLFFRGSLARFSGLVRVAGGLRKPGGNDRLSVGSGCVSAMGRAAGTGWR